MRALMISPQGSGVGYYRFKVPHDALKVGMDVKLWFVPESDDPQQTAERMFKMIGEGYDIVHCGYMTYLPYIEALVAARNRYGVPFVTDIDDDILNVPSYNQAFGAYHASAVNRRLARMHLRVSDAVSVSTAALGSMLNEVKTTVLPNLLATSDWVSVDEPLNDGAIRVMFAGNLGRAGDLEEVGPAFEYAMRTYPNMRLFFMNCIPSWAAEWMQDRKDPKANRAFAIRRCTVETYRAVFLHIQPHIVFAPVVRNEFNRSKSHIKAYDAAMCKSAFLCTDWDTYTDVPTRAAIKVTGESQWKEALDQLVTDADLRARLGQRLHDWAVNEWHVDKHVHKWVELYKRVLSKGPVSDLSDIVRPGGDDGVVRQNENSTVDERQTSFKGM